MSGRHPELVTTRLTFSAEILGWLEQRADEEGAPADSTFVAAVAALLARYAGRDDVWLSCRAGGRLHAVHVRLDGDPDAWQLLGRTAVALASAPSAGAVGAVDRAPAASVTEHFLPGSLGLVGVVVDLAAATEAAAADVSVRIDGPSVELDFRRDRFEAGAPLRIAEHLRALVVGLATAAGPVAAIPLVHGEERSWILARSNAGAVDLEESLPSVVECFERHARQRPGALAVVEGDQELTYAELDAAAERLCVELRSRGVGAGARVATYLDRGAYAIVAFLGILKARATYVPIDTSYPAGRVAAILVAAEPHLVVTRAAAASALAGAAEGSRAPATLFIDEVRSDVIAASRAAVRPDDAAYAFFTSGSTGRPKGVVVDHRALANYVRAAAEAYGVKAEDRVLQGASLGFDLSLEEIVIALTAGAALVIRDAAPIASVQAFFEECQARRVSVLSITSALWHELTLRLDDGSVALPPLLHLVILGADVARPDVLPAWQRASAGRVRLVNSYGLTETTIVATVWEADDAPLSGWRALPIGRPLRNVSAYVLDSRSELVPVGVAGEICIGGLAVGRGYLGDDALTRERFVPDPYVRGGWMYRSGDRGVLRSSGQLEFLGRADHRVKVHGVRIELGEIEARLREHTGVVEAVAVARVSAAGETELDAYVMVSCVTVTPSRLRDHLRATLPPAAVPARVHVLERFPLTPAGKIDRRALAEGALPGARTPFVPPRTPLERLVTATTAEVLSADRVGLQDSFLALGGSSLGAVRAASLLGPRLGRPVSAQLFLEHATLADLCSELERPARAANDSARLAHALLQDAVLPPELASCEPASRSQAPLESVLLTGATGYFGSFVLMELLRETRARVVCLVRAPSAREARERVIGALARRGCAVPADVLAARLSCVRGDVSRPRFDLAPEVFHDLGERLDAIFHVAARVSMLLPYEALKASNAGALSWAIQLACTGRAKTLHHVSTVEVLSDTRRDDPLALTERAAAASPGPLEGGYGQSKWVAERLVQQAIERGVRAYIHRPGRLTGDTVRGSFNDDDFLVQLLDACGRLGAAPTLDVDVDMTPVDFASRALVQLAQREPAPAILHLVRPAPPPWSAVLEALVAAGYPLRVVSHARWRSMLQELTARDEQATFLHYLASLSTEEVEAALRGGHATELTSAALGPAFEWPAIDSRLLSTYLQAMAAAGRFPLGPSPKRSSVAPSARRSSDKLLASR